MEILALKANIKRLPCDNYTGENITNPMLPFERGGLGFIDTRSDGMSYQSWLDWAKAHPDNEGDVLIQALLDLDLPFIQELSKRVFGYAAPSDWYRHPRTINRTGLLILACCVWRKNVHTFDFQLCSCPLESIPQGMRGKKTTYLTALIWWANKDYSSRLHKQQEKRRLLSLVH